MKPERNISATEFNSHVYMVTMSCFTCKWVIAFHKIKMEKSFKMEMIQVIEHRIHSITIGSTNYYYRSVNWCLYTAYTERMNRIFFFFFAKLVNVSFSSITFRCQIWLCACECFSPFMSFIQQLITFSCDSSFYVKLVLVALYTVRCTVYDVM